MAKSKSKNSNNSISRGKKVGLSVGLAAAATAAAAGAYFLYGKNGDKNRKKIKGWMVKARGEVIEKMEALDKVSEEKYHEIVDGVLRGYKRAKNASPAELAALAAELKSSWDGISRSIRRASSSKPSGSKTGSKTPAKRKSTKAKSKTSKSSSEAE